MIASQPISADTFKDCELWELEELKHLFSHTGSRKYVLLRMVGWVSTQEGLAAIVAALDIKRRGISEVIPDYNQNGG